MRQIIGLLLIVFFIASCGGQSADEMTAQGRDLVAQKNFRGAIVFYKNALEKDPNHLDARTALADAYLESGSFSQAVSEFQKVLLQNPSYSEGYLKIATAYINQNDSQNALLQLDAYLKDHAETVESLVLYGRAYGVAGDLQSAKSMFAKALTLDSKAIDPRMFLARVAVQERDYQKSKTYLDEIVALDAQNIDARYLLANILLREGSREEALQTYQDIYEVSSRQVVAYYMAAVLQMDMGDLDAASNTISQFASVYPDRAEVSRLTGILNYRQGNYDQSKTILEASLAKDAHPLGYLFLGLSYYGLNQYELALNQFQRALDINPDFERARILVATTLLKQKRVDDAIIEIQKVLRSNPQNAYAHNILGSAYLASGEYDKGMAELDLATELDPGLADAHLKQGLFHLSQGDSTRGEADLISAVQAAPEVLNSRLMLVSYYLQKQNYSAAIDTLKSGLTGEKSDALLYNYLAAAYFSQKNNKLAVSALESAKKINSEYLTPYFNLASYYASQSSYQQALDEYQSILAQDEKNLRALMSMSGLYRMMGKEDELSALYMRIENTDTEQGYFIAAQHQFKSGSPDEAIRIIDKGLQSFSSSVPLLNLQAGIYLQKKDLTQAEAIYTKLSGFAPEQGYGSLLRLYLTRGERDKASALIDSLLQDHADTDFPYLFASSLNMSEKDYPAAREILNRGMERVKSSERIQMQQARIYEITGDTPAARKIYLALRNKNNRFAPAYVALGYLDEQQGNKASARDNYRAAIKYDANNVSALNNLAYLLADNFGEVEESLDLAMKAYRIQPNDPRIMDTLGYLLIKNKRSADALKLLEKAHELLPGEPTVSLHLAMAKAETGEVDAAKVLLNEIRNHSDAQLRQQAQEILKSL